MLQKGENKVHTMVGWYQSVDPAAAWVTLNAISDQHVTVNGTDILVPKLNFLAGAGCCIDQTVASQCRLRSPSLLADGFEQWLDELASGLKFAINPEYNRFFDDPIELSPLEALQAQVLTDPAAAVGHYVIANLCDGPATPAKGRIRTIRATAAASLVAGTWVNSALTFPSSLKAGRYAVVGMAAMSANLVAARLVVPGSAWRPGVPARQTMPSRDLDVFRYGDLGVWGEFEHSSPPTVDCLGVTDTSEQVWLDLMYMG